MKIKILIISGFILSLISLATTYSLYSTAQESSVKRIEAEAKMIEAQDIADSFKKGSGVFSAELEEVSNEVGNLRELNRQMELDLQLAKKQTADLQYQLVQKQEVIDNLENDLQRLSEDKDELSKAEEEKKDVLVPGRVESEQYHVLRFNEEHDFVVFNMGSESGLEIGNRVYISRDSERLVVAQVKKVYDRFAAASIVESLSEIKVQEGDRVEKA